jgi:hypothetical protein
MKRIILTGLALAGVCGCRSWHVETPSMTQQPTVYVAPDGNDQNPGTQERPLASLAGARDFVRQHRAAQHGPVVVEFAPGVYRISEPVEFGTGCLPLGQRRGRPD